VRSAAEWLRPGWLASKRPATKADDCMVVSRGPPAVVTWGDNAVSSCRSYS
jgi:hypothetical protein